MQHLHTSSSSSLKLSLTQQNYNMEELVTLSSSLRQKHLAQSRRTSELDAIPFLTRALSQVHTDSTRLLSVKASRATPSQTTHPAALRLFASTDFDLNRLRRAISSLDPYTTFTQTPTPSLQPLRHPIWLSSRALDESRLSANAALRKVTLSQIQNDLTIVATPYLLNLLKERQRLSHHQSYRSASQTFAQNSSVSSPNPSYISAVRAIALNGDAPSAFTLLHETANSATDPPHFVETLAIIACVARHAHLKPTQIPYMLIAGAKVVLEDLFAETIPGLPQKPRTAAPAAILPAIRRYVIEHVDSRRFPRNNHREQENPLTPTGRGVNSDVSMDTNEPPVWPQVFFCLRIGNVAAALEVIRAAAGHQSHLRSTLSFFQAFLEGSEYVHNNYVKQAKQQSMLSTAALSELDNRSCPRVAGTFLDEELFEGLEEEYRRIAWHSCDPYMRACYILLMRLELHSVPDAASDVIVKARSGRMMDIEPSKEPRTILSPHSTSQPTSPSRENHNKADPYPNEILNEKYSLPLLETDIETLFPSVEDYMWLRLWLCRTTSENEITSVLSHSRIVTQEEVQGNIIACGSNHFDPDGHQPLLYAFILTSAGLFEEAVNYLADHPNPLCTHYAVHLGLVLYHLEWIRDIEGFYEKVKTFAFEMSKLYPTEAALYLLNLRDHNFVTKSLKEMIMNNGDYVGLLGVSPSFGEPTSSGLLGSLVNSATAPLLSRFNEDDLKAIRKKVASEGASDAASHGDFATAASLYYTAGKTVDSIEMIARNLTEEVDQLSSSKRPLAVAQAKEAVKYISSKNVSVPGNLSYTLKRLLDICTVFEDYWTGRYASAWGVLREAEVLPLTERALTNYKMKQAAIDVGENMEIHSSVTELVKAALHIAEYALQRGAYVETSNSTVMNETDVEENMTKSDLPTISEIKVLCIFAGLLNHSEDIINERLISIEMQFQLRSSSSR